MKKVNGRTGFTIIEVILVLAIVGLLFVALIAGQGANVSRRRYDDSVNSFVAFLEGQFDFATNIQNWRDVQFSPGECGGGLGDGYLGRSNCAIYGVMIEFGQSNANQECNFDNRTGNCFVRYSRIVGRDLSNIDTTEMTEMAVISALELRRATPWHDYFLEWGGRMRTPRVLGAVDISSNHNVRGAVAIMRMPVSNTIQVFSRNSNLPSTTPSIFNETDNDTIRLLDGDIGTTMLTDANSARPKFICIESPDVGRNGWRTVVINPRATGTSAIQLLPLDSNVHRINGEDYEVNCRQ